MVTPTVQMLHKMLGRDTGYTKFRDISDQIYTLLILVLVLRPPGR